MDETNETITVSGSSGSLTVNSATITLTDDDATPSITLTVNDNSVAEGDGATEITVTATVDGTIRFAGATAVTVSVAGSGTATAVDFAAVSDFDVTIAAEARSKTGTFTLTPTDDAVDETDETVTVSGSSGSLTVNSATITITDDEALPTVTLALSPASISETGGVTSVTATLNRASSEAVTVTVSASPVTSTGAVSGDFSLSSADTLIIAAGSTTSTGAVTVTAVGDAVDETDETVTVSGTASGGNSVANPSSVTLTLTDDDTAGFAVSPATSTSSRLRTTEDGGTATFTVALSSEPTGDVVLGVVSSDATEGAVSASSLTFTAMTWNTAQTVTLAGVDDADADTDKDYTVTLTVNTTSTADANYDALASSPVTVYARNADNEYGLDVGSVTGQATEARGTATFTVALLTRPSQAVTVSVTSRDTGEGTVSPSSLTFAATAWNTAQTVTVTGVDDAIDDGTVTWDVRLDPSSGDAGYDRLANVDVSVTTTDDDGAPGVTLALSPSSVSENGGAATVSATLSHPSGAATTVTVSAVTGFYTVGSDTTIVIAAGETANATDTVLVTAVNDDVHQGVDGRSTAVTATIANDRATADGTTMAVSGGALTLTDDEALPEATLALSPSTIDESGASNVSTVTATLNRASSAAVTLTVSASPGSGTDFTLSSANTLTIAAGSTTSAGTVTITATDNATDAPDKSVTVSATAAGGNGVAAPSSVTLTITDDEALPEATLALSPETIDESGASNVSTVTATLNRASSAAVTLTVSASPGSGTDFTLSTANTLTIAAGSTTSAGTVTITATDNATDAPDKSVTVSATAAGGNGVAAPSSVTLTITDDEALPEVALALSASSIDESGASNVSTVTAMLDRASSAAVTLTVSASPGSGTDFSLSSANTLTIAAGSTTSAGTVTITATDNATDAPDKSVTVSATAAGGNGVAAPSSVTLTITDDEALPEATLALSASTIDESGASNVSTVTATLNRPSSAAVTLTVSASPGSGTDFSLSSANTLTIAAGQTASAGTVTITAVNNTTDAPDKSVTVSATAAGGNGVAAPSSVTLTITDDEALPEATLALSPSSIDESGASNVSTVTATLNRASSAAVTLTVSASPGSGTDFTLSSANTLTIAAGSTTSAGTVTVTATDNATDAPDKSVTVSATAAGGNGVAAPSSVTLTITDDEALPEATLALSASSIDESGASNVSTVTATLNRASSAAVTLTVSASPGSGTDFSLSSANTLTIAAGSTTSAGTVTITATDNATDAPDKSVTVSATAAGGNGVAAPSSVTLTITDDEALPEVTLALSPETIDESGASNVSTVTATLNRASSAAVTLTVSASPGSGTDFSLSSANTLTIAAGSTTSAGTVTITAVDNSGDEPDIRVTVSGTVTGGNGVANPDGVTLTIRDDEGPPLATLALSPASISESGGVTTVTATLNRASSAATTVMVSASGSGFTLSSARTLTIAAGGTTSAGTVTVTAADDTTDSPDKSVTVSGSASNSQGVGGQPSDVMLTIVDDDAAPGVTLTVADTSIPENGGSTTVSAKLSHPSSAATTVTVTAVTGVYTVGSDATIAIAAGSTTSTDTVTITAVDNNVDAADNAVTVAGTAQNSQGTGTVTGASLTIANDDDAGLVVSPTPSSSLRLRTTESGGTAAFTVKLSSKPTGNVVLGVASSDTTEGMVSPSSLTFTAMTWNTAQTVTLTGVDDAPTNPADGNQDYEVTLTVNMPSTDDTNYDALSAVTVYAVNADNEYGLNVGSVTGTVTEGGGQATFTVALLTQPSQPVTVTVTSRDASGNPDTSEGTVSPSTLTFTVQNWNTAWTVTVTGADDAIDDGDVAWKVRLDTSSGDSNYAGLYEEVPVTTTDDDDAPGVTLALSPSSISENDGVSTVTATLSHPSSAATTVTVTPVTGFYTVGSDAVIVIAAGSTANATDTATVTAVNDDIDNASDRTATVTATITNSQGAGSVTEATLTLTDDDTAGFVFDPAGSLTVTADGTETYTVKLSSRPTGAVTVSIASDNDDVTVSPDSLTFTTMGTMSWNTAQPVTVTAAVDDDNLADTARLSHAASGGGYDGTPGDLSVAVDEDSDTRIAVTGARGTTTTTTTTYYAVNGQTVTVTFSAVSEATVARAKDNGFNLGPEGSRTVVDIAVSPKPSSGLRICLPVEGGLRAAARDRTLLLLRYDGSVWKQAGPPAAPGGGTVCADGVTEFSPFAVGYADTKPAFAGTVPTLMFTVDEEKSETLPAAMDGDGLVTYSIKEILPDGLTFDSENLTISGMPTAAQNATDYTLVATDADDDEGKLTFTIEVKPALEEALARLKRINKSVLPELSRAMWGSAVEAVTRRLESSGPGEEIGLSLARALRAQARDRAREDEERPAWREARERAWEDEERLSWRDLMEGRTFAVGLGAVGLGAGGEGGGGSGSGGSGSGGAVVWGGGSLRSLSLDKAELDWSGELFSAHVGVDAPFGESLRGGLAATWSEGEIKYTDRNGAAPVAGVHESRMTAVHPYVGWSAPDGSLAWGTLGYGAGEIEIADAEVVDLQKGDSEFLGAALGGSVPVLSAGGLTLSLKASGEATRYSVKDNGGEIAAVSVDTQRLRLSAEGSRRYALDGGGTLTPSLEVGGRWDDGDGETGAGMELGGGLEWSLPSSGLTVEARGRTLAAHEGDVKEWGVSGSARLSPPGTGGRGLSFELAPRWGASESGLGRLWEDGVAGRASSGGGAARSRLEAELGYGYGVWDRAGVLTPYGGFGYEEGGARRYRLGTRLGLGGAIDLSLEAERKEGAAKPEHGVGLELRIRW